jgi:Major Facilitator Superfamily
VPFYVELGLTVAVICMTLVLPEPPAVGREPWRIQVPRVPREIRSRFARASLTAGTVWAVVALFLSIVPTYAGHIVGDGRLALLAAFAALALLASFVAQLAATRRRPPQPLGQIVALAALALGLVALVAAEPAHSLALLVVGSVTAGAGHGAAFLETQHEVNELAPPERRGEVTAAFIACIYFVVAGAVISTGLLDLAVSLSAAVALVAAGLVASSVAAAAWYGAGSDDSPSPTRARRS